MIVIDDVQLTPKRVPVGGNFLLKVLARYIADGGDDVTITTQDVPLEWTLNEEAKIMYAPLDVDGDTFARILGAYATSADDAQKELILKIPGTFSISGIVPVYMYLGQLAGFDDTTGYSVVCDLRDIYAAGGTMTEIMLDYYQMLFTQLRLYILEG